MLHFTTRYICLCLPPIISYGPRFESQAPLSTLFIVQLIDTTTICLLNLSLDCEVFCKIEKEIWPLFFCEKEMRLNLIFFQFCRTLEYLSRHLYRVSLRGHETGMTAKNVAIVWAPNLLRSKSLEGGGVAALQGVGVQAVVTECLIRYCELIFNDKMPNYNNGRASTSPPPAPSMVPDLKKSRPKSLAISTPTKLLSLEEARNRALAQAAANLGTVAPANGTAQVEPQKYIEVGGGPENLPPKYHTVIDIPNRKPGGSMKQRKSPIGWKSIFSGAKPKPKQIPKISSPAAIDLLTVANVRHLLSQIGLLG